LTIASAAFDHPSGDQRGRARPDEGAYGFRHWSAEVGAPSSGTVTLRARCTNANGEAQPAEPNWNGGGFMRNVIERVQLVFA
jgi:hypothetical protein